LARKILLADDSVTAQNMGRKILTEAGYEVITVNNGSAALKKIAEQKPDIIVLDVYMPGYGGLEVCHRLKENRDTARIPVLLTVGKLEPFKAEEARRVRADMHIVKPFEASELLTAITQLEDRIVAQADVPKVGRFAKGADAEPQETDRFGDGQGGWKSRLAAPRRKTKSSEGKADRKAEPVEAKQPPSSDLESDYNPTEGSDWRSLLPPDVPQDIKPNEAAAIVAAATSRRDESPVAETVQAEPVQEQEESKPGSPAPVVAVISSEDRKIHDYENSGDREVADALASLVPAQGVAEESSVRGASGSRWIAQAMQVTDEEAKSFLEHEMERAYASLAVADTTAVSFAMGPLEALSFSGTELLKDEPAAAEIPVAESASQTSPVVEAQVPALHEDEVPQTAQSEPAREQEAEVPVAQAESATEARAEEVSTEEVKTEETKSEDTSALWLSSPKSFQTATAAQASPPEAAFAAAASAGAGDAVSSITQSAPEAVASSAATSSVAVEEPGTRTQDTELAAAWQSWRQGRTNEPEPQAPASRNDSPVAEATEDLQNETASAHDEAEEGDSEAISSIVDSMLADLKPKLMQEIAKKMGKDKNKDAKRKSR